MRVKFEANPYSERFARLRVLSDAASCTADPAVKEFLHYFPYREIISLKRRTDRRQRLARHFSRIGLDFSKLGFKIFDALEFEDAGGFPNAGIRGCFMSHLALLKRAAKRSRPTLICEDDFFFLRSRTHALSKLLEAARNSSWDILYAGPHMKGSKPADGAGYCDAEITCAHCYAVKPEFAARMVRYLEESLERPTGHPDGGRIHVDGSFNDFRRKFPDSQTLIAYPPIVVQFPSRTDLGQSRWWDTVPVLHHMADFARRIKTARLR